MTPRSVRRPRVVARAIVAAVVAALVGALVVAGPAAARGRGRDLALPHRVEVLVELGRDDAKERVYAESVRAALTDLVSATARHPGGALATHTHGFTHPDRCERQRMRLDHGPAEVLVEGWIPLRARVDGWTDDQGAAVVGRLPHRTTELMDVPGHRLGPGSGITAVVHRDACPAAARGRGRDLVLPHRVEVLVELGRDDAKGRVYAESVRAALADLVAAAEGARPRSGGPEALAAIAVADAARRSALDGTATRPSFPAIPAA